MSNRPDMNALCAGHRSALRAEPFASIVPDRRPVVRYHAGLGRAKSAVAYVEWDGAPVRGGEIYWRDADGWTLLFRVEYGTQPDDLPWRTSGQPQ